MCGLFGFIAADNIAGPDVDELLQVAQAAAERGPHGWGMVTYHCREEDPTPHEYRRHRELGLPVVSMARVIPKAATSALLVVGHCRLATTGHEADPDELQPLKLGPDNWFAHNGTVPDADSIAQSFGMKLTTGNDSEVLGRLATLGLGGGGDVTLVEALSRACNDMTDRDKPFAAAWLVGHKIALVRRGHPLWVSEQPDGLYFGSVRWDTEYEPSMLEEHLYVD